MHAGEEKEHDASRSRLGVGRKLHLRSAAPRPPVAAAGGDSARRTRSRFPVGTLPLPPLPLLLHACRLGVATAAACCPPAPAAPHQLHPARPHAASLPPPAPGPGVGLLLGRLGRGSPPRAAQTLCCPAAAAAEQEELIARRGK